ncbi:hypothetical protein IFM89_001240 [Coptis chinensis]|uniref:Uncharacterized protein n=1 Tax=Coptis chinensis TaxID=261450 RepID=A0A835H2J2_9MAGN|nr:hypothetical protein IFM89_001240 [Coptis chinensis]
MALNSGDSSGTSTIGGMPSGPGNASLLGWAMSSLTLKGKGSEQAPVASSNANPPLASASSNASSVVMDTPDTTPIHMPSSFDTADQHAPPSPTSTDGWGELENGIHDDHESDKDGWDDVESLEELKPPPLLANIQAAQKRPVAPPKAHVTSIRPQSSVKVAKDEDDDLWGSIAAPAPRTASKPLNSRSMTALDEEDPWAAIAAPPPVTKAKPLSLGRGRGAKPAAPKLGAQRINRASSGGL